MNGIDKMLRSMQRAKEFEQSNETVPDAADKYINDNYNVYGAEYNKRDILVNMVMKKFNVDYDTASVWITYSTT